MKLEKKTKTRDESHKTSKINVLLAWMFVGIPLLWGVYQVVVKSLTLFY